MDKNETGRVAQAVPLMITPENAAAILAHNTENRNLSKRIVARYAAMMTKGQWENFASTIYIDAATGVLLDGQHRLGAVRLSQKTIGFYVVKTDNWKIQQVIDTGKTRTGSDVFTIAGVPNARRVVSIIRLVEQYKKCLAGGTWGSDTSHDIPHTELWRLYHDEYDGDAMQEAATIPARSGYLWLRSVNAVGAAYYVISRRTSPDDFFYDLAARTNLRENSPIHALQIAVERWPAMAIRGDWLARRVFSILLQCFIDYHLGRSRTRYICKKDDLPPSLDCIN